MRHRIPINNCSIRYLHDDDDADVDDDGDDDDVFSSCLNDSLIWLNPVTKLTHTETQIGHEDLQHLSSLLSFFLSLF